MKIAIVGAGYVGLTTGACLAEIGHTVTCLDIDARRIARLKAGEMPIYEPGLEALSRVNREAGRLAYGDDVAAGVGDADAVFLAVGTPSGPDGDIDLTPIERAARQVAPNVRPDAVIVVKSTVVAGTARRLRRLVAEARGDERVPVAANPEFLREGSAVGDFLEADRIVAGADDRRSARCLRRIYRPLCQRGVPYVDTDTVNAEMVKYAANAFLALKIGFINHVADLCEAAGGDVADVARGVGLDRRIGAAFLAPGPGYGGSCFPKDTRAFAALGRRHGAPQWMIETLIDKNEERKRRLAARILGELERAGPGRNVAVLGLAFKARTDDVRESAALTVIPALQQARCRVSAHDPQAIETARPHLPGVALHDCPYRACEGADAVVILTEWDDYRALDLGRLASAARGRTIVDCRNLVDPAEARRHRLDLVGIGRPARRDARAAGTRPGGARDYERIAASPA
ncbi:UDP-glucose/GDP-mannose dehydrogenase family protein [Aquibium sp. A9E412]|uniref:UDP-glucose dehydrogenase family protein n=1 Tax=Aquibium sp. A9E412 TaxID=2976767 RepID=UPI0025AED015|nr:UDP-glucose/GDP-mannose dehydrogenase family protein [Aquibium sp. A9E412]MDN2564897.1 UDP-glucose/GDP-mannose dehydrogenase family protein [Aquibium sp. A9E412]